MSSGERTAGAPGAGAAPHEGPVPLPRSVAVTGISGNLFFAGNGPTDEDAQAFCDYLS